MSIRSKLLVLLLVISLLPLALVGGFGQAATRRLGRSLADRTWHVLMADAGRELRQVVNDHAVLLQRDIELIELIVRTQAREVERSLAAPPPEVSTPVLFSADLDPAHMPEDFRESPRYFRLDGGGRPVPVRHSLDRPVLTVAPGVDRESIAADAARLGRLAESFRFLFDGTSGRQYWQYVSLQTGVHAVFPGHGDYPRNYDPRERQWYLDARKAGSLVWIAPMVDATTRRIIQTVAMPVVRPGGDFAGVTAIDIVLTDILDAVRLPDVWAMDAEVLLVVRRPNPETERDGLLIITQRKYREAGQSWRAPIQLEWLGSADIGEFEAFSADVTAHRSGVREMEKSGRPALWAHGSLDARRDVSLVVIVPRDVIVAQAEAARAEVLDETGSQLRLVGGVIGTLILGVLVLAFAGSRTVTRPVRQLARAASRVAEGDFQARVEITSNDEIGDLGRTFNDMVPRLADQIRLKDSLAVAQHIQQHLLPQKAPSIPGLDIAGLSQYCDETGGDYFDYFDLTQSDRPRLGVVVGDVTGHGIAAALLMATARVLLRQWSDRPDDLAVLLSDVNRKFAASIPIGRFMTLSCLLVDVIERRLIWASAGHDPALLYDPDTDKFLDLDGAGLPLGIDAAEKYHAHTRQGWHGGEVIVLSTDGVWEMRNADDEQFGKDAMKDLIRRHATRSAAEIVQVVSDAVGAFRGKRSQADDATLVVVKLLPT